MATADALPGQPSMTYVTPSSACPGVRRAVTDNPPTATASPGVTRLRSGAPELFECNSISGQRLRTSPIAATWSPCICVINKCRTSNSFSSAMRNKSSANQPVSKIAASREAASHATKLFTSKPSAVVTTRNSRQRDKSTAAGSHPSSTRYAFAASKPNRSASTATFTDASITPSVSHSCNCASVRPAKAAAASMGVPVCKRALRHTSPM